MRGTPNQTQTYVCVCVCVVCATADGSNLLPVSRGVGRTDSTVINAIANLIFHSKSNGNFNSTRRAVAIKSPNETGRTEIGAINAAKSAANTLVCVCRIACMHTPMRARTHVPRANFAVSTLSN